MTYLALLRGVFIKSSMELEYPPEPISFNPLTDQTTNGALQLYLVAFIEYHLKQQNGNAVNVARAFRDYVTETAAKLNQ